MRTDALRRRNSIIAAGSALLIQAGTHMTVESVAERAKVGIATLYRNFPTREHLLHACISNIADNGIKQLNSIANCPPRSSSEAKQQLITLASLISTIGLNIVIPAIIQPPESSLAPEFLDARRKLMKLMRIIDSNLRATELIHPSISILDFYTGIIALCAPPHFSATDTPTPTTEHLIDIFTAGCKTGVAKATKNS